MNASSNSPKAPKRPFFVERYVGAVEQPYRVAVARQIEPRHVEREPVLFAQIDAERIQLARDAGVAEAHAHAVVVAVEVARKGVDRRDVAAQTDVLEDGEHVGVFGRERAVGDGQSAECFALEDKAVLVDFAVDAAARRQEAVFQPHAARPGVLRGGGFFGRRGSGFRCLGLSGLLLHGRFLGGGERRSCQQQPCEP